jgi:citrate lyase subunit beta/citryl-CoA lyase
MSELRAMRSAAGAPMDHLDKVEAAVASGADVLMVDLEVAPERRQIARGNLDSLFTKLPDLPPLFIRVAPAARAGELAADLAAVTRRGLTGVIIPDCEHPDDVRFLDAQLEQHERDRGLPIGGIRVIPLPETALAILRYYEILTSSPRVVAAWFPSTEGGDLSRDVGYKWTPEGKELIYMRSKVVLDARAAGVEHILDSSWRNTGDLEGFERDTVASRSLGYTARLTYSPKQAAIANRAYAPTDEEVRAAEDEIRVFNDAKARGIGVLVHNGRIVDITTAKFAERTLKRAGSYSGRLKESM